jgi:type I restriction enzyme R subunit
MIRQLVTNGWLLGIPDNYNRQQALYEEDVLGFVKYSWVHLDCTEGCSAGH